jgi:methylenetetrahydrofolate reductase (NADPH)
MVCQVYTYYNLVFTAKRLGCTTMIEKSVSVSDLLRARGTSLSFEFFPPKSEAGAASLQATIDELSVLPAEYSSVTYGAGGSTQAATEGTVSSLAAKSATPVVSHLTCVGTTRDQIFAQLERYQRNGVTNILALRGDPPKGSVGGAFPSGDFAYASDLVAFIKEHFPEFCVGVAGFPEGHPDTPNRLSELDYFKAKIDAGADYICTQLYFDNRDFFDYRERCEMIGIDVPIVAGILPLTSFKSIQAIAGLALGSRIPAPLMKALSEAGDSDAEFEVGVQWAAAQVSELIETGVPGMHFYTLNKSQASIAICEKLGLCESDPAQAAAAS